LGRALNYSALSYERENGGIVRCVTFARLEQENGDFSLTIGYNEEITSRGIFKVLLVFRGEQIWRRQARLRRRL